MTLLTPAAAVMLRPRVVLPAFSVDGRPAKDTTGAAAGVAGGVGVVPPPAGGAGGVGQVTVIEVGATGLAVWSIESVATAEYAMVEPQAALAGTVMLWV